MNQQIIEALDEARKTELLCSELYFLYTDLFPEDVDFWWTLTLEEKTHAAILETEYMFLQHNLMDETLLYKDLDALKKENERIERTLKEYKTRPPDKKEAYQFALSLENSGQEAYFQMLMSMSSNDRMVSILQELTGTEINHATRIQAFLEE